MVNCTGNRLKKGERYGRVARERSRDSKKSSIHHVEREIKFSDYSLQCVRCAPELLYCGDNKTTSIQCELVTGPDVTGHTFRRVKHSCHRPVCRVCGDDVITARTYDVYRRLTETKRLYAERGVRLGDEVELIISPPPVEYARYRTREGMRHMSRSANEFARRIGLAGGCVVLHAVRGEETVIESYMSGEVDLDFSPHYHFIGYMPNRFLIPSPDFNESTANKDIEPVPTGDNGGYVTGWTYKTVLKSRWGKGLWEKIQYELDHAFVVVVECIRDYHGREEAVVRHMPVNRWVGIVGYNNVVHEEEEVEELCKCGRHLHLVREGAVMADRVYRVVHVFKLQDKPFMRAVKRYRLHVVPVVLVCT